MFSFLITIEFPNDFLSFYNTVFHVFCQLCFLSVPEFRKGKRFWRWQSHALICYREHVWFESLISLDIILQFLGLFGDAQLIKKAEDRHARLFLPHRSTSELRKRHAEDFLASERAKMAKSYSGAPSPAQSLMGAYPSSQNPWAAGYGVQPQTWPPATQAQAQQWNQQVYIAVWTELSGSYVLSISCRKALFNYNLL